VEAALGVPRADEEGELVHPDGGLHDISKRLEIWKGSSVLSTVGYPEDPFQIEKSEP